MVDCEKHNDTHVTEWQSMIGLASTVRGVYKTKMTSDFTCPHLVKKVFTIWSVGHNHSSHFVYTAVKTPRGNKP